MEFVGIELAEELEGQVLVSKEVVEAILLEEPLAEFGAAMPSADVADGNAFGGVTELLKGLGVFDAVAEQAVELIAKGLGELGDLGTGEMGVLRCYWRNRGYGNRGSTWGSGWGLDSGQSGREWSSVRVIERLRIHIFEKRVSRRGGEGLKSRTICRPRSQKQPTAQKSNWAPEVGDGSGRRGKKILPQVSTAFHRLPELTKAGVLRGRLLAG